MILHLDMDAFFASVEQMDNPALRGQPVIVGGSHRGVVATASYEARAFGIHSAMPMITARRLCPHGHFLRGRGQRYSEISARVMARLRSFSPVVQTASIDEAYLDISGLGCLYSTPRQLAMAIKQAVALETGGLTCSIGIAPVKFLAKISSDINKPDGIFILPPARVDAFLFSLPVGKLPGVGRAMQASLQSYGVTTVAKLRMLSREFLLERYGKIGQTLHDRAYGRDERKVHENLPSKSESAEKTFATDVTDRDFLIQALLLHAEKVGAALRRHGNAGHTVTIKIKFSDFRQITRSRTIAHETNVTSEIHSIAVGLLEAETLPRPVRLIGLSVSGFGADSGQYRLPGLDRQLEPPPVARSRRLDAVMDALRERFGRDIVHRAAIKNWSPADLAAHNFE